MTTLKTFLTSREIALLVRTRAKKLRSRGYPNEQAIHCAIGTVESDIEQVRTLRRMYRDRELATRLFAEAERHKNMEAA